ncbi:hypothetical protein KC316_g2715 [Hortaea werneckii]|nr:hypothetical protein KC324_g2713 [Hortaea werneckii]KAI7591706.1 hypothetical protein KC316_g2715 [Hortaea werneckii]
MKLAQRWQVYSLEAIPFETRIEEVTEDTAQRLQFATQARRQLEADDPKEDPNVGMALIEVKKELEVYEQGLANAEAGSLQAKAVKLNQKIGDVFAGENAKVNVGMPQGVIEKVSQQIIGNVKGEAGATVNVGIFT